jgi:hypothetical protein
MSEREATAVFSYMYNISRQLHVRSRVVLWREIACFPPFFFKNARTTKGVIDCVKKTIGMFRDEVHAQRLDGRCVDLSFHKTLVLKTYRHVLNCINDVCAMYPQNTHWFVECVEDVCSTLSEWIVDPDIGFSEGSDWFLVGDLLSKCNDYFIGAVGAHAMLMRTQFAWKGFFQLTFDAFVDCRDQTRCEEILALLRRPFVIRSYMNHCTDDGQFSRFVKFCSEQDIDDVSLMLCDLASGLCSDETHVQRLFELVSSRISSSKRGSIGLQQFSSDLLRSLSTRRTEQSAATVPQSKTVEATIESIRNMVACLSA